MEVDYVLKNKKKFKNIGKITATAVFALLFFLNIKIMLNDDIGIGDLSLFGLKLNLFDATYATGKGGGPSGRIAKAQLCSVECDGITFYGSEIVCVGTQGYCRTRMCDATCP